MKVKQEKNLAIPTAETRDRYKAALQEIVDRDDECGCDHSDESCCSRTGEYCGRCIAAVALAKG